MSEYKQIENYKIAQYIDETFDGLPCYLVDFRRHIKPEISLQKKVTKNQSWMQPELSEYFYNEELLAKIRWTFDRNARGLMVRRKREMCYIDNNGEDGAWWVIEDQLFSLEDQDQRGRVLRERKSGRSALIDDLEITLLGILEQILPGEDVITLGGDFVELHGKAISAFIRTGSDHFEQAVMNDTTTTWLNALLSPEMSVRQYILARLS